MATRRRFDSESVLKRTGLALAIGIASGVCTDPAGSGRTAGAQTPVAVTLDQLQLMGPAELEAVYQQGIAAAIPPGRVRGTALLAPGTRRSRLLSRGARLVWQGKVFAADQSTAINRFFGLRAVRAAVYRGPSWYDGQPSLVLDYQQTSRVYASNRDEIRQVAPGLFLGLMYNRNTLPPPIVMYFALESTP